MTFRTFLQANARWLTGGMVLTLFSAPGQTFYLSLFAGYLRADFDLSHGSFGLLYMLATLASAATLVWFGRLVDVCPIHRSATLVIVLLAAACALMASAQSLITLVLAIYALRLLGQGMMTHIAMTAMGRWFRAERGRAVSVTAIGFQLGEGLLPLAVVTLLLWVNWRIAWWLMAVVVLLIALPIVRTSFAAHRQPQGARQSAVEVGRQWRVREILRDPAFWLLCTSVLAPAFIGTSVFFHQVHIAEIKHWGPSVMASGFAVMSVATVSMGLLTGQLVDRYSAQRLLPLFLLPLMLACAVLAIGQAPGTAMAFMALLGVSYGISGTLFGAIWPEIYGTRHLGAIRGQVYAAMVFASALGPGLTGWLIDAGTGFETQLLFMAAYCGASLLVVTPVSRFLLRRTLLDERRYPPAPAQ